MNTNIHWLRLLVMTLVLAGCAGGSGSGLDPRRAAEANTDLGIDYLRNGHYMQAIEKLEKALEYDSRQVDAHWALAVAYQRINEPGAADRHYQRALDLKERPEILNSYGVFHCQQERVQEGLEYLDRAANDSRYPGQADALANAGLCLDRAGQQDRAEEYFRRALERDDRHRPTLAALARRSLEQGDNLRARGFFQRLDATESAQTPLADEWLLLGARIESALGDRETAAAYLQRYNERNPNDSRTLERLDEGA
jgi:type IV pilus assembly protein PilF